MWFQTVKMLKSTCANAGVGRLCMLFGRTRHAFYDRMWYLRKRDQDHLLILEMVAEIRREIPRIGTTKLYQLLNKPMQSNGIKMGRDKLHHLLLDHGLTVRPRKRYTRTTNSRHWMKKYPNLIRQIEVTESEQVWVADITYIFVNGDFNFLNLITDNYSKRIMGYCLHPTLESIGTIKALKQALVNRQKPANTLIHHSDRGTQYCCMEYVKMLQEAGISISMTEHGDPYENPVAERVNGILKDDFELDRRFSSRGEALLAIDRSIKAYNELRPHLSCNLFTPSQAHDMYGPLKKRWKHKIYSKVSADL
jgi:putative transposase